MSLMKFMPPYYRESPVVVDLQGAFGSQTEALAAAKEDLFKQFTLDTATWGLANWEKAYGLEVEVTKDHEYRRSRVRSKMRSTSTTTLAMIKNVAESFSNGSVELIEEPGSHHFEIKFVGNIGIPPNMEDLQGAVEELKPAHLAVDYTVIYRTHLVLRQFTHAQLSAFTHRQIREEDI